MIILESKTRNTSRSIKWGIINKVASIVLPFAVRTTIIYFLGIEYAGLGSLFTSILSVLSLAELGFSSAIVFSMYKPVAENDIAKVNAYLNFYRRCYRIIGSIVLIIGLVLMPFIPYLINGGYPADINIYVLYCIYLFNTVISYFLFAYKRSIFSVTQRNDIISNISTILLILADFVQIGLLCLFRNYYTYIVIIPVMTIANNVILAVCAKRIYPEIKGEGEITKDEKRIIYQKHP